MKRVLLLIFACGIVLRLIFLCVGLRYVPLGSDEAILGLMAKHIWLGEFPLITWVQPHGGTLEAYLDAPLYLLFGAGKLTVRLLPFIFSLLFLAMGYLIGREYFGEEAGLITASLIAIPPVYLSILGSLGVSMNFPALLGSAVIIYAAHRAIYGGLSSSKKLRLLVVMGLVGGITFWVHPIVACALASAALFLFINDRRFIRKDFWVLILSFIAGSAPLWVYNFGSDFATFKMAHSVYMPEALTKLKTCLTFTLPSAWGMHLPTYIDSSYFIRVSPKFSTAYAAVCMGLILVAVVNTLRRRPRRGGLWLLLFFLIMNIALFSKNSRSDSASTRYLALTFIALMPVISAGLRDVIKKSKAFFLFLCFIIGFNLAGNITVLRSWAEPGSAEKRLSLPDNNGLISFLKEKHIRCGYMHYWLSYPVVFKTNEAILISPAYDERFGRYIHPYLSDVQSADHPAYIFHSRIGLGPDWFERELLRTGAGYKSKVIDSFTVFYDFEPLVSGTEPVERDKFSLSSNYGEDSLSNALDGSHTTRWGTASQQEPGMVFAVDMGQAGKICGALLHLDDFQHDFPRALKIYVSCDGEDWKMVYDNPEVGGGLYWDGGSPRIYTTERYIRAVFKPVEARWVRLVQGGYARMDWSITEFEVLRER